MFCLWVFWLSLIHLFPGYISKVLIFFWWGARSEFNTDVKNPTDRKFTAMNIAAAAEKSIVSDQQGPKPILLVESCLGNKPSVKYPVCELETNDWEHYLDNKPSD